MRSPGLPKFGERLCVASLKRDHLRGFEKKPALAPFDCIADFFEQVIGHRLPEGTCLGRIGTPYMFRTGRV